MKGIVIVRGRTKDLPDHELRAEHNELLEELRGPGASLGNTGHRAYRNTASPGELMVIDIWDSLEGAEKLMSDPDLPERLAKFFDGVPDVTVWAQTDWDGYDPR